jgi:putative hydrolase of the HAD superfamily
MFLNKVKAIIFDLDNTLYDETLYLKSVFSAFLKVNNLAHRIDDVVPKITKCFRDNNNDIIRGMLKLVQLDNRQFHNQLFDLYCNHNADIKLSIDNKKLLLLLRKQGFSIGILTNGVVQVQQNKVHLLGLAELVDIVVYAREKGPKFEKPHGFAFKKVCQKLHVEPASCVMVGDNLECDIVGALNFGLSVVYLKRDMNLSDVIYNDINIISVLPDLNKIINYDF